MTVPRTDVIVVAAGRGERVGAPNGKAFVPLLGEPMLVHTLRACEACSLVTGIIAVVPADRLADTGPLLARAGIRRVREIVPGGARRQDSVAAGLARVDGAEVVVVHDGARPAVRPEVIAAVARAAVETGAASAGIPVRETVKTVDAGEAVRTEDRERLWIAHTPQAFRTEVLREAHARAAADGFRGSDDAVLVERLGRRVRMVEDSPTNVKITVPDDLLLAERLLGGGAAMMARTGMGVDAHRLVPGRRLRLGGVEIPHPLGLAGHSDADVLLHAVMDALLGAAGLGDIGTHFPPEDPAYRDADSLALLRRVGSMLAASGWTVRHVDAVVLAEAPRIAPHAVRMREAIAGALAIAVEAVSLKATTAEGLGAVGRGEGITAYALATVSRTG